MKKHCGVICLLTALFATICFGTTASADVEENPSCPVIISELMASNHSTIRAEDGSFPDWVELFNNSAESFSLKGLVLTDRRGRGGKEQRAFPDVQIPAFGRLVVFADGEESTSSELHVPFKIKTQETVYLMSAEGNILDELCAEQAEADSSVFKRNGEQSVTSYPTPGFENTREGFIAFQESNPCDSALQINEVRVSDLSDYYRETEPHSDWVELINVSDQPVWLGDYFLSDDDDNLQKYHLPEIELQPGGMTSVLCTEEDIRKLPKTGFALNAGRESLFLSCGDSLVDYVSLHDIPYTGSYGRLPDENGFFYLSVPSMNQKNNGRSGRVISKEPTAVTQDGLFVGSLPDALILKGEGTIYYTTDGSAPSEQSEIYTEPIPITETSVIRAMAVQGTDLPSRVITNSFFVEEHHSLPIISIVGNSPRTLSDMLLNGQKYVETPGNLTMYEKGEKKFSIDCGLKISGQSSRVVFPKRNIKVNLRNAYGSDCLGYDLFDTGFVDYDSFVLRAGQDSAFRLFSNEIWQDLCLEMSDSVLTQHGKHCIVYVNGEYYGIYVLKENISKKLYASWTNTDVDTVESEIPHDNNSEAYVSMYDFIRKEDMSDPENYSHACSMLDVDSFIDWCIIEGVCGNFDLFLNVRFFRNTEIGGRYQMALFDLDNSMNNNYATWNTLFSKDGYCGMPNTNATNLLKALFQSPQFREAFLRRYGEVYDTALSNVRVLERIDHYESLILPEIDRDRKRWGYSVNQWKQDVETLRKTILEKDWQNFCVDELSTYIQITDSEREKYFR